MDVTPSHLVALRLSSTAVVSERISGGRKRSAGTGCVFFFTWAKSHVYFWVEGEQAKKLEAKSLRWRGTEDEKEFENVSQWL